MSRNLWEFVVVQVVNILHKLTGHPGRSTSFLRKEMSKCGIEFARKDSKLMSITTRIDATCAAPVAAQSLCCCLRPGGHSEGMLSSAPRTSLPNPILETSKFRSWVCVISCQTLSGMWCSASWMSWSPRCPSQSLGTPSSHALSCPSSLSNQLWSAQHVINILSAGACPSNRIPVLRNRTFLSEFRRCIPHPCGWTRASERTEYWSDSMMLLWVALS